MADIYCNDGYEEILDLSLAGGSAAGKYLRLYQNDYTPVLAEAPGHFTECSMTGYAAIPLSPGTWVDATGAGHVKWTYPSQTFTFTGAGSVYGYYVTDSGGTKVYWAGRFPVAPFSYSTSGGVLNGSLEIDGP